MAKQLADKPATVLSWTFLTNHAYAMVRIDQDPELSLRGIRGDGRRRN